MTVSRETSGMRGQRLWLLLGAVVVVASLAVACSRPPKPRGWTGAVPVTASDPQVVLAAHKKKLYAFDAANNRTTPLWQFPPTDRSVYHVSAQARDALRSQIENASAGSDRDSLRAAADALTVKGQGRDSMKSAIDASSIDGGQKKALKSSVDAITVREEKALTHVVAFYGDIGLSSDAKTAYVPGYGGWLYALDVTTGDLRWTVDLGSAIVGGVAVGDDAIYVGAKSKKLFALNPSDGSRLWTFKAPGEIWATPTLAGDAIYVTSLKGTLHRLDKQGKEQWKFDGAGAGIGMRPVVNGGTVYVGSFDNRMYAVNANDGSKKWSFKADDWMWSAPLIEKDVVYAASLNGKVYAINAGDGSKKWDKPVDIGAEVRAALARGAEGVVVAGRNGLVHELDFETGKDLYNPFQAGSNVEADLTADNKGNVYAVPHDPTLYIVDTSGQLAATFFSLNQ